MKIKTNHIYNNKKKIVIIMKWIIVILDQDQLHIKNQNQDLDLNQIHLLIQMNAREKIKKTNKLRI